MKQKIAISVMTLGTVLLLSGCGLADRVGEKAGEAIIEKNIESQTGGKVDIDQDSGQMNIKSEEGNFSMSGEGTAKLSPDFPKDIFIATDAKIIFSMANGKDKSYSVAYITEISADEIYTKYKSDLEGKGWAVDSKTEVTIGNAKTISYEKGTQGVTVIVGTSEDEQWRGKTSVHVTGTDSAVSSPTDSEKNL